MRVAVGADHAGFPLTGFVKEQLTALGHEIVDVGTFDETPVDFPDITARTAHAVLSGAAERGVLVCGSGAGAIMAANKIDGIRCALTHEPYSAHQAVEHDDANLIAMGAWLAPRALIRDILDAFLTATFDDDEDTRRRVRKLQLLEQRTLAEYLNDTTP
ncbi:RpiB/LacA/LacB family sugar-phosphate isomerase [Agromyces soli]|uniref:RpiB/LacA/LacB family sugar-phosphate isomerase n=1 Tax=Agromyces soli TaxID=659012 RepID=A0ABY4AUD8_9MICO|nr:RpiB/LacA/LacB family sugar-phosphate isomerase [Agromyces soli]UOE26777.1 RpiB/LacA/LacB family sugar-phosphate isomerase [Agromyces soli]